MSKLIVIYHSTYGHTKLQAEAGTTPINRFRIYVRNNKQKKGTRKGCPYKYKINYSFLISFSRAIKNFPDRL